MPILGLTEIISLFLGVVIALTIARAQISKRHIRVEVFTSRLPKRIQAIIDACKPYERLDEFPTAIGLSPEVVSKFRKNGSWIFHELLFTAKNNSRKGESQL